MRRIIGYVLSVAGMLIVAGAIIIGAYHIVDALIDFSARPGGAIYFAAALATLATALGIALRIIGKHLSGWGGLVFPHIRAYVTSGPVVVAEMIGAAALWGVSAFFAFYLIDLISHKPYRSLGLELILGLPLGVLIPFAAGFALLAASRIPAVPAAADAPPPRAPVILLGNVFTVFGILWLLFAGTCTWTGGFNPGHSNTDPGLLQSALLSLAFGAMFVAVGLWLRRIAHMTP